MGFFDQNGMADYLAQQASPYTNAYSSGALQGLTAGWYPQLKAGAVSSLNSLGNLASGNGYQADPGLSYDDLVRLNTADVNRQQAPHPGLALAGNLVGGIVPALATEGGSTLGQVGTLSALGALQGGSTAYDAQGNPLSTADRLRGAAVGGAVGAGLGGAGAVAQTIGRNNYIAAGVSDLQHLKKYISDTGDVNPVIDMITPEYLAASPTFKGLNQDQLAQKAYEMQKMIANLDSRTPGVQDSRSTIERAHDFLDANIQRLQQTAQQPVQTLGQASGSSVYHNASADVRAVPMNTNVNPSFDAVIPGAHAILPALGYRAPSTLSQYQANPATAPLLRSLQNQGVAATARGMGSEAASPTGTPEAALQMLSGSSSAYGRGRDATFNHDEPSALSMTPTDLPDWLQQAFKFGNHQPVDATTMAAPVARNINQNALNLPQGIMEGKPQMGLDSLIARFRNKAEQNLVPQYDPAAMPAPVSQNKQGLTVGTRILDSSSGMIHEITGFTPDGIPMTKPIDTLDTRKYLPGHIGQRG